MRKVSSLIVYLMLFFGLAVGERYDRAVTNISALRQLKQTLSDETVLATKDAKTIIDSESISPIRSFFVQNSEQSQNNRSIFPADKEIWSPKSTASGLDTLNLTFGSTDTVRYVAGNEFVFIVQAPDTVFFEMYLDDGNGLFNPDSDFSISDAVFNPIYLVDGEEPDMTPTGDGIVKFTMNTINNEYGVGMFFCLQGQRLFLSANTRSGQYPAFGIVDIQNPSSGTLLCGEVQFGLYPPNVIVTAIKVEDENPVYWYAPYRFYTFTNSIGQYYINIPDSLCGEYSIQTYDVWNCHNWYYQGLDQGVCGVTGINLAPYGYGYGQLTISVKDESGNPMPGIRAHAHYTAAYLDLTTNIQGLAEHGTYYLPWHYFLDEEQLSGDYMLPDPVDGTRSNLDVSVEFTLYKTDRQIEGNVTDQFGNPIANKKIGAFIKVPTPDSTKFLGYHSFGRTDAAGHYVIKVSHALQGLPMNQPGNPLSSYTVSVVSEDVVASPLNYPTVTANAIRINFIVYPTNAVISGIVRDAASWQALVGTPIHAYTTSQPKLEKWLTVGDYSRYELNLLGGPQPDGITWVLDFYYPEYWKRPALRDTMTLFTGERYNRDDYLSPPSNLGQIEGIVHRLDGSGISGARVEFYSTNYYEVYTNTTGYYTVDNVIPGLYSGTAYAIGYPPCTIMDIFVGEEPIHQDFWMDGDTSTVKINGWIKQQGSDTPISHAIIMPYNANSQWEIKPIFTDSTGYFESFLRRQQYSFAVGANGYWASMNNLIQIGNDTTLTFFLSPATITDTLKGRIVDPDGNPLRSVMVYCESATYIGFAWTNFLGKYTIPLPVGDFNAAFMKDKFRNEFRMFSWPGSRPEDPLVIYPEDYMLSPWLIEVVDVPRDQGKQVRLKWKRAVSSILQIKEYQIWRALQPFEGTEPNQNMTYEWEYIATVPYHPDFEIYYYVAPTLYDKVKENIYWTGYMVTAVGLDGWSYWDSNLKGGWSEDNLAPEIPKNLTGTVNPGSIALKWEEVTSEPVKYYTVYRKVGAADFIVLDYAPAPEFVDNTTIAANEYQYSVSATDYGLNESIRTEPIKMTMLGVVEERAIPTEFGLSQNFPNPFNPVTEIEIALPRTSGVTLTIYNLMGQVIREFKSSNLPAGYHSFIWDARNQVGTRVGSGVYIYTLTASEFKQTKKMILLR